MQTSRNSSPPPPPGTGHLHSSQIAALAALTHPPHRGSRSPAPRGATSHQQRDACLRRPTKEPPWGVSAQERFRRRRVGQVPRKHWQSAMEASRLRRRVRQRRIEASPRLRRQAMELRGLPGASCHRRAPRPRSHHAISELRHRRWRSVSLRGGGAGAARQPGASPKQAFPSNAARQRGNVAWAQAISTWEGLRSSACKAMLRGKLQTPSGPADKAPRPVDGYRGPRPLQRRCARAAPGNIRAGRPSIADGPSARCQPPRKRCCGLSPALSGVCAEAYVPRACKLRVRAHPAPASWPLCRANLNQLGRRDFRRPATASSTRAIPMPNVQCGVAATASGPLNTHANSHIFLVDKECPQVKCGTRVRR